MSDTLIHREDGRLETRVPVAEWEIRHSGRPQEAFTVRGYAAVFDQMSLTLGTKDAAFREKIAADAFDEILSTDPDVHFVWDHDTRYVLSRTRNRTLSLRTDDVGLYMDAQVGPFSYAKDLRTAMEGGYLDQASFTFSVPDGGDDWKIDEEGRVLRTVNRVDGLYDVTVTAKGAYPQTSLVTVRSLIAGARDAGRLPEEAEATFVAEEGEAPSQPGGSDESAKRIAALRNRMAVARDELADLSERASKL